MSTHPNRRPAALSAATYGLLAALALFAFFPIYWMLATSLSPNQEVFAFPPRLAPRTLTLEHYANFFGNPQLIRYALNSLLVASATAVGSVMVSAYAAYSFSKFRYRGRGGLMYLILSFTTFTLPLCIWMLKGYFDKMPNDLIEAAKVDGASQWTIIHRVLLPIARPALVATGLFAFIRGWNDFIFALTLAGPEKQTLPPGLVNTFIGEASTAWPELMAASLVVSLPVAIAFIALQRYLVGGMTAGAVKG